MAMELQSDILRPFLVWGLRSGDETVVGNRRLHMLKSHDQMMCLIFIFYFETNFRFLKSFTLRRPWKRYCMEMFKFSECDLEQTTTKCTIIVYTSLNSSFATIEQTPHRIVLFWQTPRCHQPRWLESFWLRSTLWLAVLIRLTKPVTCDLYLTESISHSHLLDWWN